MKMFLKKIIEMIVNIFKKNNIFQPDKIFTPGGIPEYTYFPRSELQLHKKLIENLKQNKVVIVTGQTKSGKSVLVNKAINIPRIWIDGGSIDDMNDFWDQLALQLNSYNKETIVELNEISHKSSTNLSLGFKDIGIQTAEEFVNKLSTSLSKSRDVSNKTAVLNVFKNIKLPIIIDDFHYIKRDSQLKIIRSLKNPVSKGLPVILIAIPHRKFDPVRVEREMSGRTLNLEIPTWEATELNEIAFKGFPLLKIDIDKNSILKYSNEAIGSPHLMQEFCLKHATLLRENINLDDKEFFHSIAIETSRVVFDKLLMGPRQRKDRKVYSLPTGEETDIYGVILFALSTLKPGIQTFKYEEIRNAIKDSINETLPAVNQISRTLKYMSNIAYSDESSTPVIDWEPSENLLHITDPYFAYFLRWGLKEGLKG